MSVTEYRERGYLPDAVINYLVRLGWSHGDQEFFTREELIAKFSLDHIGKSAGIFDPQKMLALNADHIKAAVPEKLVPHLAPMLAARGVAEPEPVYLAAAIETLQARSKTLLEMADGALFYFKRPVDYDPQAAKKFLKPAILAPLQLLIANLEQTPDFSEAGIEGAFVQTMAASDLKLGKIAQPVRVALTGKTVSPGIFEIIRVLGREESLKRLKQAAAFIAEHTD